MPWGDRSLPPACSVYLLLRVVTESCQQLFLLLCLTEGPHLYPLDPEAQRGGGTDGLPPLHVAGLSYCPQHVLLLRGSVRVHLDHLLVHVLPQARLLSGLYQLLLQVRSARRRGEISRAAEADGWETTEPRQGYDDL